jgi:hypothetical protein
MLESCQQKGRALFRHPPRDFFSGQAWKTGKKRPAYLNLPLSQGSP